ncbi:glucan biosynthesis protein G [Acetobacteraceae bacterium H6797]|nr:glucan biosynthesis protein G [Acetobacteraceae bacterium H6797]
MQTFISAGTALTGITPALAEPPAEQPFDGETPRRIARELAQKSYSAPSTDLPKALNDMSYDEYRRIRFDPQRALWKNENLPFQLQAFHRGFLYRSRVDLFEVSNGKSRPIAYSPDLFIFQNVTRPDPADLGFAGFRLHAPINRPDYFDEVCAFLGASYFRAVGKDLLYGLSARGLSIRTGDAAGEEFPAFRTFWIEKPREGMNGITVHALLDSESATAAYRFFIKPGEDTVFDVESTVFPRVDIPTAGIAPLTSMFMFNANNRNRFDDYRPAVHDSDGLMMATGRGEQVWRPLANPRELQISVLGDINPRGFGLMQRARGFSDFDDLEARYERRPSLWVEPIGDWGEGAVHLVEIPTTTEIHDNIVAFWRPKDTLKAKGEYRYTYRLHWLPQHLGNGGLARLVSTASGNGWTQGARLFVLEAQGGKLADIPPDTELKAVVEAGGAKIANVVVHPNPETKGWRLNFEMTPGNSKLVELRAQLQNADGQPLSETWIYRWTA